VIYLFLVPALVAAIWAWRMAEGSKERLQSELAQANYRAEKWQQLYNDKTIDLLELSKKHSESLKWDMSKNEQLEQYRANVETMAKNCSELVDRIEALQNQIDGLEIDKIHLKYELGVHREEQQKRREQKAASMRRFRAKQKEAKG
jgi:hypothetical protein